MRPKRTRFRCQGPDIMAETFQPGAINDAADHCRANIALRRGRINMYQTDEMRWTIQRLNDRVSFSGWFFAMISGLCLWALMFHIII